MSISPATVFSLVGPAHGNHIAELLGGDSVPPLPSPPIFEHLLFEQPLMVVLVCLAVAAGAVTMGLQSQKFKVPGLIAGVAALVAVVFYITAGRVETDREAMDAASRSLIEAIAAQNTQQLGDLLSERFVYDSFPARQPWDKQRLLDTISATLGQYDVTQASVLTVQAESTARNAGRTQLRVRPDQDGRPLDLPSWWGMSWRNEDGVWRCTRIEPLAASWLP